MEKAFCVCTPLFFPLTYSLLLDLCFLLLALPFSLTSPEALVVPLLTRCSSANVHINTRTMEKEEGGWRLPLKCAGDMYPLFRHDI